MLKKTTLLIEKLIRKWFKMGKFLSKNQSKKQTKKWQEHLLLPMLFMMVSKELCLNVLLDKKSQNPLMIIQLENQKFQPRINKSLFLYLIWMTKKKMMIETKNSI